MVSRSVWETRVSLVVALVENFPNIPPQTRNKKPRDIIMKMRSYEGLAHVVNQLTWQKLNDWLE